MANLTTQHLDLLPYGNPDFSSLRSQKMIYVDKTALIAEIARQRIPLFFARPRRFGKSLLINTLHCLFENGLKQFHGLDIEKIWNDTTYHVVHLDFSEIADSKAQEFKILLSKAILNEFDMDYQIADNSLDLLYPNIILSKLLKTFNDNSLVLLIDEYDAPLVHHMNAKNELQDIQSTLNNFYSTIKRYTGKFRFIFITGVTRSSHVSIFSAFNNLKDLSLREEFNSLLGFTQNDLERYFDPYFENASQILNMCKEDIYKRIEQYYDGFQFSLEAKTTVYNPWSILSFLDSPQLGFSNYWFESSGASSLIMQYIKRTNYFDILYYRDQKICKRKQELSAKYEIYNIPPEILLLQTGYFTIRKETNQTASLIFPNTEVEDSILDLYLTANNFNLRREVQLKLDELYNYIDDKNILEIIQIFNGILNDYVSILSKIFQDERSVRDIIYAALPQDMNLQKIKERETVKGCSNLELLTQKTHMLIEFKRTTKDRAAAKALEEAITQIQSKQYGIGSFINHKLYRVAMVIGTEEKAILYDFCKEIID